MPIDLTITDRTGAGRLLMQGGAEYLISIGDDDRVPAGFHRARGRLRLVFDDLLPGEIGAGPTVEQIRQIADFGRRVPEGARLLVHCYAGISRSPAAAMIVLMARGASFMDAQAIVKSVRPQARPNRLMLELWEGVRWG